MKRVLFFFSLFLITGGVGLFIYTFFFLGNAKGALQVTANVESKVYLGDTYLGTTPLCKCGQDGAENTKDDTKGLLSAGEYTIRLVPTKTEFSPFQEKITIGNSVLTVVDRKFLPGSMSEGSIIFLTPLPDKNQIGLSLVSLPDKAKVLLDSESVGETPVSLNAISESDHSLLIQKEGYKAKEIRIRTTNGYMLHAKVYLGIDPKALETKVASPEASPTPTLGVSQVEILETGTGFLRVRDSNSLGGKEIGRVSPGDLLPLLDEQPGWYQVSLKDGAAGWVSSQFAKKVE